MEYDEHGGNCCGINHLWGFSLRETLQDVKGQTIGTSEYGMDEGQGAVEVVLTDYQLTYNNNYLLKIMKEVGYKHCTRWINPNTGNGCNLFVWHPKVSRYDKCPFDWANP